MKRFMKDICSSWGNKIGLPGAAVAAISAPPSSLNLAVDTPGFLVFLAPQPAWHLTVNSVRAGIGLAPQGAVQIFPAHTAVCASWSAPMECVLVLIEAERLQRLSESTVLQLAWNFPNINTTDPMALFIAREIRKEVDANSLGNLSCVDALLDLLSGHMLRTYSNQRSRPSPPQVGGLGAKARKQIDDHLAGPGLLSTNLQELASIAHVSVSHFTRAFRKTYGSSPHQYIMQLRLRKAKELVVDSDMSLAEVSRAAGFSSNSHMTTAMRQCLGITPSRLRSTARASRSRMP